MTSHLPNLGGIESTVHEDSNDVERKAVDRDVHVHSYAWCCSNNVARSECDVEENRTVCHCDFVDNDVRVDQNHAAESIC